MSERCFFADVPGAGPCGGPTDPHHLVRQQHIRWEYRPNWKELAADERNLVPACRNHHEAFHAARLRVPRSMLPASVHEFVAEHYALSRHLDRDYPRERAA